MHYRDVINVAREKHRQTCSDSKGEGALLSETREFISFALLNEALRFGSFTLKVDSHEE
jgi:hypothetical protein